MQVATTKLFLVHGGRDMSMLKHSITASVLFLVAGRLVNKSLNDASRWNRNRWFDAAAEFTVSLART